MGPLFFGLGPRKDGMKRNAEANSEFRGCEGADVRNRIERDRAAH